MTASNGRRRRRAAVAMAVVTALLVAAAAVTWYARSALADTEEFTARATAALDDSDLRVVLADRVVGALTPGVVPNALAVRPLIVPVVAELADTTAFRRVFARVIAERHRALVDGERSFAISLPLGEAPVYEALRRIAPRVAEGIPPGLRVPVLTLDPFTFELEGARALDDFAGLRWPLLIAALVAAVACALLAGGVRSALTHLGVAVAGAGLLIAGVVAGLGEFVVSHAAHAADLTDERERGAVRALWNAFFGDLAAAGLVAALGGSIVAAVSASRRLELDLTAVPRWVSGAATSPRPAARIGRALVLIAAGAALVLEPALLGRVALAAAGALIALVGVMQLAPRGKPSPRWAEGRAGEAHPAQGRAGEARLAEGRAGSPPPPGVTSPLVLAGAVGAAVAATVLVLALVLPGPSSEPLARVDPAACNGSPDLCDRRLDEVVFPATHNSYAAADEPGWFFANQRFGIERQLEDGIRAFLIDVHLGAPDPENGRVRTDLQAEGGSRNKVAEALGPQALRTADRLVGRAGVGRPEGERQTYLCHTLCELGAEPIDEQFALYRAFLDANPREVLILFVEPYVPVEEIERALTGAGLLDEAAEIRLGERLPTLGELIRERTRLVVLAEQDGGARPWYLPGFDLVQDTPLGARLPAELRCSRFRGEPDSPMLLLNHWIDTFPPSVSRNERIGADFLEQRARRCGQVRGLTPNLLAVDFYERSDVVEVARRLNAMRP
jgi:hypothetical protein